MNTDEIAWYRGKPINDMSREELLEVVRDLGKMVQFYRSDEIRTAIAYGQVEMLKRGER